MSTPQIYFSCILCYDKSNGGIGYKKSIPWSIPSDMKRFKTITTTNDNKKQNVVIMGRLTWESIGSKPLPNRINIIISTMLTGENCVKSFDEALSLASLYFKTGSNVFVIGGSSLYAEAIKHPNMEYMYVTRFETTLKMEYDTYINKTIVNYIDNMLITEHQTDDEQKGYIIETMTCVPKSHTENSQVDCEYTRLALHVLENGEERKDRTGTGTRSLFGPQMEIDLEKGFPLLTTKRVPFKAVAHELLWLLSGDTNIDYLKKHKVKIWDGNTSRAYLDKYGFTDYPQGELGAGYGFQWRNFGGTYYVKRYDDGKAMTISGETVIIKEKNGVDQIQKAIDTIKNNPTDRRIFISAWNPKDLDKAVLPPCHLSIQFYVSRGKYLSCKVYMRSNDIFLGNPFNIASYALLTHMIGHLTNLIPKTLILTLGDVHSYNNHIDQLYEQIIRPFRQLPTLKIKRKVENIDSFTIDDFEIEGYYPHPAIKGEMAV